MHALHEFLGEYLARLKVSSLLRGTKDRQPSALEFIDNAKRERKFRTNNRQVRMEPMRELNQLVYAPEIGRNARCLARNARISRRTEDLSGARRLAQLPHQSMLSTPTT